MPAKKSKEAATKKAAEAAQTSNDVVLIGKKPIMNYVIACLTFFNSGSKKVTVKARGKIISRAVDTVELLRRGFAKNLQLQGIAIATEEVTRYEGRKTKISTIEITVTKP